MTVILSPSVMCADMGNLESEIRALDNAGCDVFHMDIMDGEFVPNFALSWADYATVRRLTDKPMDAHLMVKNPAVHLPFAYKNGANIIYVHFECGNAEKYLADIRAHGVSAGLAVNPETEISEFANLFPLIDNLLVMRVNPGFAGQKPLPIVEEKIAQLTKIPGRNFKIALDGSVGADVMQKWAPLGVEEFVCGTACGMFGAKRAGRRYDEIVRQLRQNNIK